MPETHHRNAASRRLEPGERVTVGNVVSLGFTRYGKAEVHVSRVSRGGAPDGGDLLREWTVATGLSGDLADTHLVGDNSKVLATDTQKNTVFALAHELGDVEPEILALRLAGHFVETQEPITRARIAISEQPWQRLEGAHSFVRGGAGVRTCVIVHDETQGVSVVGGIKDLVLMNTTDSEFWGFPRDKYTTLPETKDRILATEVTAQWRFRSCEVEWSEAYNEAVSVLLHAFSSTYSYSLQQTLYACASAIINAVPAICEVRMTLPNKHHFLFDLSPFGQQNDNEVYIAADRPFGLIEGAVLADDAPAEGLAWS